MSITANEIVWRRPVEVSDVASNGGRMTGTSIASGTKNNILPDVPQSERTAGSTKYRKVFLHVANDSDLALIAPKVYVETSTPGEDSVVLVAGTQRDIQSNLTGSEQKYGCGVLNATVAPGVSTIVVACENAALNIFPASMVIRVSDKASVSGSGNEEFRTVQTCNYVGNLATLVLTAPLTNGYNSSNTKVSSVLSLADVASAYSNWVLTSAAGTYNTGTYPVLGDSISTVEQDWTLTFTSATQFTLSGDTVGALGTFNVSSDTAPLNPVFAKPYFTLRAAGFGGTYDIGNTITFKTSPAAIPIWYRRDVPAGANSLSGNSVIVAVDGESA